MSKTKIRVGSHTYDMADEKLRDHVGYVGPSDTAGVPSLAYELSADGTYYIVTGRGTVRGNEIVIPDTSEGKPVEEIGAKAFYGDEQITKITVGANVSYIGGGAFICPNLAELYFTRIATEDETQSGDVGYWATCDEHDDVLDGIYLVSSAGDTSNARDNYIEYPSNLTCRGGDASEDGIGDHEIIADDFALEWTSFA